MASRWKNQMDAKCMLLYVLLASIQLPSIQALAISYCSSDNTAGNFQGEYGQFMSNGECQTLCQGSYVFAVLQGSYCWCSNYVPDPSTQTNTLDCNQQCPGFGSEWCGSTSAGLFGYYNLGGNPLGTAGAQSSPQSSVSTLPTNPPSSIVLPPPSSSVVSTTPAEPTPAGSSSASLVTVGPSQSAVPTSSLTVELSSSVSLPVSSDSTSSTSIASSPSSPSVLTTTDVVTSAPPPSSAPPTTVTKSAAPPTETQVYTSIMTVTGQIKTVLVTPTSAEPAATSSASLPKPNTAARGISTGKVVGIVIGVALGLGLLIGLGVFFWLRRKHRNSDRGPSPDGSYHSGGRAPLPSRQVSQMSSSTLLGKTPMLQTKGLGPSDTVRSAGTGSSGFDRRSLGTDQRLNPNALYAHEEAAISSVSLQDNHDYSRQLRVANPDLS